MTALRVVRVVEDADPYKKACVYAHRRGGNDVPGRARIPPALACSGHPPLGKGGFVAGGQWPSVRQKDRRKKDLIHRKRSPFPVRGEGFWSASGPDSFVGAAALGSPTAQGIIHGYLGRIRI